MSSAQSVMVGIFCRGSQRGGLRTAQACRVKGKYSGDRNEHCDHADDWGRQINRANRRTVLAIAPNSTLHMNACSHNAGRFFVLGGLF